MLPPTTKLGWLYKFYNYFLSIKFLLPVVIPSSPFLLLFNNTVYRLTYCTLHHIKPEFHLNRIKNAAYGAQKTNCANITKIKWLILLEDILLLLLLLFLFLPLGAFGICETLCFTSVS
jgi:hypothetical protein